MRKRIPYIIASAVLLAAEILIGLFVHDRFVRPYFGDVLVTALLCCLVRIAVPEKWKSLALWVFLFSVFVEFTQLWGLSKWLGVDGTLLGVILGSSFSYMDILCYFCGCLAFFLIERYFPGRRPAKRAA